MSSTFFLPQKREFRLGADYGHKDEGKSGQQLPGHRIAVEKHRKEHPEEGSDQTWPTF